MKQMVSILWKDVRHLWPEVGMYIVLLIAFAVVTPQTWPGRPENALLALFAKLLTLLLAVSWFVLITLVVHEDRLVGEEQFWITRPYRWSSLLAAKFCFVMVCVILPFLLMQWSVLLQAGLHPLAAGAGMSQSLLMFLLINWLPLMLVAAVTETLAAAFTSVAGIAVVWAGALTFAWPQTARIMSPPYVFPVFSLLFGGLLLALLIFQYARRDTLRSRVAAAAILLLFLVLIWA